MTLNAQVIRNAKLWCDVESAKEAEDLSKQWDWTLVPGFTASKILWLKNNEPENFSKLAKVLLPHDYFNYYLTGRYCMEASFPAWHAMIYLEAWHAVSVQPLCCIFAPRQATRSQLFWSNAQVATLVRCSTLMNNEDIFVSFFRFVPCFCMTKLHNMIQTQSVISVQQITQQQMLFLWAALCVYCQVCALCCMLHCSKKWPDPVQVAPSTVDMHNTMLPLHGLQAGDASGTGLFDTAKRTYDSQRLGSIDSSLEDKFPQLIGPNEV